jgi:hypothetical protein
MRSSRRGIVALGVAGLLAGGVIVCVRLGAAVPSTSPAASSPALAELPPPDVPSVHEALARVFAGAVIPPGGAVQAMAGDFNGDGAPDLAVVVSALPSRLGEVNDEYANWKLADLSIPPGAERPGGRLRVESGEPLLAIIHGHGPGGWRASGARQAFLIKNAARSNMKARAWRSLLADQAAKESVRLLHGDVIAGAGPGPDGLLLWTGGRYAWRRLSL